MADEGKDKELHLPRTLGESVALVCWPLLIAFFVLPCVIPTVCKERLLSLVASMLSIVPNKAYFQPKRCTCLIGSNATTARLPFRANFIVRGSLDHQRLRAPLLMDGLGSVQFQWSIHRVLQTGQDDIN